MGPSIDREDTRNPVQSSPRIALTCVLDDTPEIWACFLPWLATAIELAEFSPREIVVHHACPLREDVADLCQRVGVATSTVEPFDRRSPHANKIRQLETDFGSARDIVLTDVDTVFGAPLPMDQLESPVAGKPVDAPNPPLEVLSEIFEQAGVAPPNRCSNVYHDGNDWTRFETLIGNFNGGLYVVRNTLTRRLGEGWAHWVRWLLDRPQLLDRWQVNVDQIGFCLATSDLGLAPQVLGNEWNFPTTVMVPQSEREPYMVHHHGGLDEHQRLTPVAAGAPSRTIERVNAAIDRFQRQHFDNRAFWNYRYNRHPTLGSGIGSRHEFLALKRELLSRVIPEDTRLSILDWGCGDLEVVKVFQWADYWGVDLSTEALRIARAKRPDWRFSVPDEFDGSPRDFILCLDVLIHQRSPETYRALLDTLVSHARIGLLIAGYDRDPDIVSHITFFHEPLGRALESRNDVCWTQRLTEFRDTAVYFVGKRVDNVVAFDLPTGNAATDPAAAARTFLEQAKEAA